MNIMKNLHSVGLLLVFVVVVSSVSVQAGKDRHKPDFSEFDLDGDGVIIESEFNEAHSKRISERAEEGRKMKNLGKAHSFSDIDTNDDGEISTEEFIEHQSQCRKRNTQ
ncbi:MAG: EF-hand domain-containing protein [Gammaproteobacteria bacterium]|nr:MAG: EF-hand domain-containing protein [Gammaproteobacteria bacterium]